MHRNCLIGLILVSSVLCGACTKSSTSANIPTENPKSTIGLRLPASQTVKLKLEPTKKIATTEKGIIGAHAVFQVKTDTETLMSESVKMKGLFKSPWTYPQQTSASTTSISAEAIYIAAGTEGASLDTLNTPFLELTFPTAIAHQLIIDDAGVYVITKTNQQIPAKIVVVE